MVVSVLVALVPAVAAADPTPADDAFVQGKALMDQGRVDDACAKFAESLALEHRPGTLLNLAICRQRQGRHATAMRLLFEARAVARRDGRPERVALAERALAESQARVAWLRVRAPADAEAIDLHVAIDGEDLPRAGWGVLQAADPGKHTIRATASGRKPVEVTVEVGGPGDEQRVEIPDLVLDPPAGAPPPVEPPPVEPPPTPPPVVPPRTRPTWQAPVGWSALGIGLASLAIGTGFGVKTLHDVSVSNAACPKTLCMTTAGYDASLDAQTSAKVADATMVAGAVFATAGVVLLLLPLRASSSSAPAARALVPSITLGLGRASLRGAF